MRHVERFVQVQASPTGTPTAGCRLDAQHDNEVNTMAEMEILGLHGKLDELRDQMWVELMMAQ